MRVMVHHLHQTHMAEDYQNYLTENQKMSYQDFKTGTVNWINKKYEEPIIRTGTAPSGTYTICMTAKNEQGDVVGMENCIIQVVDIKTEAEITLISPTDREQIKDSKSGLSFVWSPPMPPPKGQVKYTLKIVELLGNQSGEEGMKKNSAFFEKREILTSQYQYSPSDPNFKPGSKYAWRVIGLQENKEITSSNVFLFDFGTYICGTDSLKVTCNYSTPLTYDYSIKVINPNGETAYLISIFDPTSSTYMINPPITPSRLLAKPKFPNCSLPQTHLLQALSEFPLNPSGI